MIFPLAKQYDAAKIAVIFIGILFLLAGCSTTYAVKRSNWKGFMYVVDQRSVDSLRKMLEDTGHNVVPWEFYKPGAVVKLDAGCREYGPDSAFIAHVPLGGKRFMRYCLVSPMFPLPAMVAICRDLSVHLKIPLEFAWVKEDKMTFACGPPFGSKA